MLSFTSWVAILAHFSLGKQNHKAMNATFRVSTTDFQC